MKLIVGLGNPGPRYTFTRHNIGWRVLDAIAVKEDIQFKPGKGDYLLARKMIGKTDCAFIKPMTFMNDSGIAVAQALDIFRADPGRDILIILDEFQLPLGSVKLKAMGGDGGHNGLASILYYLETERVARLRCGIDKNFEDGRLVDYVLSPFTDDEEPIVEDMVTLARDTALGFATMGTVRAMNTFNQLSPSKKGFPPEPKSGNQ
ncbi:MAG TPA: aminoacyl-tRNA hydrolase [Candidatus Kapabacteria bacterium]|nr:aminoacyl-tRNA hydrolase [Candidatus Kapabacteria bacterium]